VLERYVSLELKDYRRIFRATDEAGQLDNISRRFAWFRRLLQIHEVEQGRVFPAEWKVGWHLLARFVEITRCVCAVHFALPALTWLWLRYPCRDDMTALLSKAGSSLTVKQLLDTLQATTEFEASMVKKWATSVGRVKTLRTILANSRPPSSRKFSAQCL
jgi:hypothetical protein